MARRQQESTVVPCSARVLRSYRHLVGPRVLYCDDGTSPTNKEVRLWMEKAQRRAGLQANGGYHILRHTFCSHLAMQGATVKAIVDLQKVGTPAA
jgi:site-specific recombinase XerD